MFLCRRVVRLNTKKGHYDWVYSPSFDKAKTHHTSWGAKVEVWPLTFLYFVVAVKVSKETFIY